MATISFLLVSTWTSLNRLLLLTCSIIHSLNLVSLPAGTLSSPCCLSGTPPSLLLPVIHGRDLLLSGLQLVPVHQLPQLEIVSFITTSPCIMFLKEMIEAEHPNINTYLTSYMRSNGYNPSLTYADFVFLSTAKVVITGIFMPFIGNWARKIGTRPAIALGSAIYSLGFLLTYFTVKHWFFFAIVSLSCHGIGFSFVYATAIGAAQNWFPPNRKGLVGSIVVSGYGFGSLFWVPLQTLFVNPDNVKAVIDQDCEHISTDQEEAKCDFYFVDKTLLEKVPWMFFLLGVVYSIMGIIAVCLISDPEPKLSTKSRTKSYRKEKEEALEYLIEDSPGKVAFSLTPLQVMRTPTVVLIDQIFELIKSPFVTSKPMLKSQLKSLKTVISILTTADLKAIYNYVTAQTVPAITHFMPVSGPNTLIMYRVWDLAKSCPQAALDWLSIQVTRNRYAQTWLLGSLGDWVEIYLIAHNNVKVRNSAAFLLVSLVPTPHFRQTFCTLRNPPSQLRDTIEANDGLDTVRRILEFLLSLLKNCKQYIDISCHGSTKLVSYFQEMTHLLLSKHEKLLLGPYFQDLWQLFHPKLSEPSIPVHQNKQALLHFWYSATVDCPENIKLILTNPHVVKNIAFNYILADHEDSDVVKSLNRMKQCSSLFSVPGETSSISGSKLFCSDQCFSHHRRAIFKQTSECDACKKTVQTSVSLEAQIRLHFCDILCKQTYENMCLQPPSISPVPDEPADPLIFTPAHLLLAQAQAYLQSQLGKSSERSGNDLRKLI